MTINIFGATHTACVLKLRSLWCKLSSMKIKNLKEAAERIKKAVKNKERIVLYGDSDLDGITSVLILKETIRNLGGDIAEYYFPFREDDGYGINKTGLKFLKKQAPALFISMDLGITNFKEVDLANKMGFEVIIIDHHEIIRKLPNASIIVDPKQEGDEYPFKVLANVGIVFHLAGEILKKKLFGELKKDFLILATLGTISDMVPEKEDNKEIVEEGLAYLKDSLRPGIKIFKEIDLVNNYMDSREFAGRIISVLSAGKKKDNFHDSFLLLTSPSLEDARGLAKDLIKKSEQKRRRIQEITDDIEGRISDSMEEPIIFEGDISWDLISLGSVASRVCEFYQKPAFIFVRGKKNNSGSVRMPKGMNAVKAMDSCSKFLEVYGGHPLAAGFTVKDKNVEKFKQCLLKYFEKEANSKKD